MCHKLFILIKLLFLFQEILGPCPTSILETCKCWNKTTYWEDYTLSCSKPTTSNKTSKLTIRVKPNVLLDIECDPDMSVDAETILALPQFNFQYFETLRVGQFPLVFIKVINDIITALKITVQTIRFQSSISYLEKNWGIVSQKHFENLENKNLQYIIITGFLNVTLPQDIFSEFSNLSWLTIKENRDIKFERGNVLDPLVNLQGLELTDNGFKTLPQNIFKNLKNLKFLSLRNNDLTLSDDDKMFQNLNSLVELDLSYNNISTVKNLDGSIFRNNKKLSVLNLSNNPLKKIDESLFKNLENLQTLRIDWCELKEISEGAFNSLKHIGEISVTHNQLESLPDHVFEYTRNLRTLNLDDNLLSNLSDRLFERLTKLENLYLSNNNLNKISAGLFQNLTNLRLLDLFNNRIKEIHLSAFIQNEKLEIMNFSYNLLEFSNCSTPFGNITNLKDLNLSFNRITQISVDWQTSLPNLRTLNLYGNRIKTLERLDFVASGLTVDLQSNQISYINMTQFEVSTLLRLRDKHPNELMSNEIILSNNPFNCDCFMYDFFRYVQNMMDPKIKMQYNLITDDLVCEDPIRLQGREVQLIQLNEIFCPMEILGNKVYKYSCPENCICNYMPLYDNLYINCSHQSLLKLPEKLPASLLNIYLDVSHNNLENLIVDFIENETYRNISILDASNNKISKILLKNGKTKAKLKVLQLHENSLTNVDVDMLNIITLRNIIMFGNPWVCALIDLISLVRPDIRISQRSKRNCSSIVENNDHAEKEIQKLSLDEVDQTHATYNKYLCPGYCICNYMLPDDNLYINCSYQNLRVLPEKLSEIFSNIILDVTNNNLEDLIIDFSENKTYRNISILDASNNKISKILLENGKSKAKLKVLKLHHNKLRNIDADMLNIMTLENITLFGNPWVCSCDLISFIRSDKRISQLSKINCGDTVENNNHAGKKIIELSLRELCQSKQTTYIVVTFSLVFVCLIMSLIVVYLYNKTAIKVCLYQHNIHVCFCPRDSNNKTKLWDAFISYSSKDEDFVVNELIPNLEQTSPYFRLCIHERDWIAGEWIPVQIAHSVENSSRTIVVLSKNFLTSVWGRMEFRVAHFNALSERKAKVIIIKLGEIGPVDEMDSELRAYLKLNTYIEWGTTNFWPRLRYALPHKIDLSDQGQVMRRVIERSLEHTQLDIEDSL